MSINNGTRAMTYGECMRGVMHNTRQALFVNVSLGLGLGIKHRRQNLFRQIGLCRRVRVHP
ncbi:MAG: hypothetical protein ACI308_03715 [Muribaculaceae bacterium]